VEVEAAVAVVAMGVVVAAVAVAVTIVASLDTLVANVPKIDVAVVAEAAVVTAIDAESLDT